MVTIVTDVELKEGAERKWDAVMRERMTEARKHGGWVGGQLLRSEEDPNKRVIVGTWKARSDWEQWHKDPRFADTRRQLDDLVSRPAEHWWHDVVLDVRPGGATAAVMPAAKTGAKRSARMRRA
jgi:heme-degrading monooxygenase HmoA